MLISLVSALALFGKFSISDFVLRPRNAVSPELRANHGAPPFDGE